MRTLIIALLSFIAVRASAQSKVFCLQPSCSQTINVGDSAFIFAQITASDGFGYFTWSQKSGPTMTLPGAKLAAVGAAVNSGTAGTQSGFEVTPTAAGTYVFAVTGVSYTGSSASTTDTLFVNAAAKHIAYVMTVYSDSTRVKTQ